MDKKAIIAIGIVAIVVIAAVAAVVVSLNNNNNQNKSDLDGTWEIQKEFTGTYKDVPTVTPKEVAKTNTVKIEVISDYAAKVYIENEVAVASINGNTFEGFEIMDGFYRCIYGFLENKVLNVYTITVKDKDVSVVNSLCAKDGYKVPEDYSYVFNLKEGDVFKTADIYGAVDMEEIKDLVKDGCTLTVDKIDRGFMFYTVKGPMFGNGNKTISIPIGSGMQKSVSVFNDGTVTFDTFSYVNNTITLQSNMIIDGKVTVFVIAFTADGKGALQFPFLGGVYSGQQRSIQLGKPELVKDFMLTVKKQIGPIVELSGTFKGETSRWIATLSQMANGDFKMQIISVFTEDGTPYLGFYNGTISRDLSSITTPCFAYPTVSGQPLIGLIKTKLL